MEKMMNNIEFLRRVAYEEQIHNSLHGAKHGKAYTDALRIAARSAHVEGIFDDATFDKYGLATGGPFAKQSPAMEQAIIVRSLQ
jgi:hypothetical protein